MKREGEIKSKPLTPDESVNYAFMRIRRWLEVGLCETCALKAVSHDHGINYDRLRTLWEERHDDQD